MNKKTAIVMHGFFELNEEERRELIDTINDYYKRDSAGKISLGESVNIRAGVTFGPLNEPCPCCGR